MYACNSEAAVGWFLSEQTAAVRTVTDSALAHFAGPARLLCNSSLSSSIIVSVHALVSFLPLPFNQGHPNLSRPRGDWCLLETQGIIIMGERYQARWGFTKWVLHVKTFSHISVFHSFGKFSLF